MESANSFERAPLFVDAMRPLILSLGLPVLNRGDSREDGWLHIVPKGELPNKEAGVVQVLDETGLAAILENLRADSRHLGNRWPGLYGGEEHFIYDESKSSEAFWWGREFELRGDGLWGRGEFTDIGREAIKNKRFKFTSFVVDPSHAGALERLGNDRVRVRRIDTVGFTNFANGKHLLTPITNRAARPAEEDLASSSQLASEIAAAGIGNPALRRYLASVLRNVVSRSQRSDILALIDPRASTPRAEQLLANRIKSRADALQSGSARTFQDCWTQAQQEILAP